MLKHRHHLNKLKEAYSANMERNNHCHYLWKQKNKGQGRKVYECRRVCNMTGPPLLSNAEKPLHCGNGKETSPLCYAERMPSTPSCAMLVENTEKERGKSSKPSLGCMLFFFCEKTKSKRRKSREKSRLMNMVKPLDGNQDCVVFASFGGNVLVQNDARGAPS
jgi:hypothetical protein